MSPYPGVSLPTDPRLASLFRVPINYVLEVRVRGVVVGSLSVPNDPNGITLSQPHATSIEHTLGASPVREHTRNKERVLVIRGSSGARPRSGYNSLGQVIFADGPVIQRQFQEFLDEYQKSAEKYPGDVEMVFRAFDEGWDYLVEPEGWVADRDARTRSVLSWQLRLRVYGDTSAERPLNILSPVSDAFEEAALKVAQMNAYLALAGNAATNARGDLESLRAPLLAAQQTLAAIDVVTEGARGIARFPGVLLADLAVIGSQLRDVWGDVFGSRTERSVLGTGVVALQGGWESIKRSVGYAAEDTPRDAVTALGLSGGGGEDLNLAQLRQASTGALSGRAAAAPRTLDATPAATAVVLRAGETLRAVAQRFYGDADRWGEIASFNGWRGPERLSDGSAARPGVRILVPTGVLDPEVRRPDRDPFLHDVYVSPEGDFEYTEDGDLRTVRGPENFKQAVRLRMLTIQGQSPGFPRYGLPRVVGGSARPTEGGDMAAYIASHVREQALRDSRVQSVRGLEVLDQGDEFQVRAVLVPQDGTGEPLSVLAPIPGGS